MPMSLPVGRTKPRKGNDMKRILVIFAALAAAFALAQEKPNQPQGGKRGRPRMMQQAGPWVVRMLSNKETLEKIGVSDAEAQKKILAELEPLKKQGSEIEKKIRQISRQQAELTHGLFEDKARDPKPVMDKIAEVAELRAEQGRISVKAMLVLRDKLAPEQLEKAKTVIFERGRERGRMRRGEGARSEARDGEGPSKEMRDGEKQRRKGRKGQGSRRKAREESSADEGDDDSAPEEE